MSEQNRSYSDLYDISHHLQKVMKIFEQRHNLPKHFQRFRVTPIELLGTVSVLTL